MQILSAGEVLLDITLEDTGAQLAMSGRMGGSPANVAVMLSALGTPCGLISVTGQDAVGAYLMRRLGELEVQPLHLSRLDADTLLALVELDEEGVPAYTFRRDRALDELLGPETFARVPLDDVAWLHTGSLALLWEAERQAYGALLERALAAGITLSLDPNVRRVRGVDMGAYRRYMSSLIPRVQVLKASSQDLASLFGAAWLDELALLREELPTFVTRGERGSFVMAGERRVDIPASSVPVVDTTGCGDAFMAAVIRSLMAASPTPPWPWEALEEAAREGVAVAGRMAELPGAGEAARSL